MVAASWVNCAVVGARARCRRSSRRGSSVASTYTPVVESCHVFWRMIPGVIPSRKATTKGYVASKGLG